MRAAGAELAALNKKYYGVVPKSKLDALYARFPGLTEEELIAEAEAFPEAEKEAAKQRAILEKVQKDESRGTIAVPTSGDGPSCAPKRASIIRTARTLRAEKAASSKSTISSSFKAGRSSLKSTPSIGLCWRGRIRFVNVRALSGQELFQSCMSTGSGRID
jgi:hypothetical protein